MFHSEINVAEIFNLISLCVCIIYFVLKYTNIAKENVYSANVYSGATENTQKKMHFVAIYNLTI